MKTLKLNLESTIDWIVFLYWRYLHSHFYEGSLFLSDFEPNFFKVLESFITPNRKHILIKRIKLRITTFGDDSEHHGIRIIFVEDLIFQAYGNIYFLNWSREQDRLTKGYTSLTNINKVFGLVQGLILSLRWFAIIFFLGCIHLLILDLILCFITYFHIFHHFFQVLPRVCSSIYNIINIFTIINFIL